MLILSVNLTKNLNKYKKLIPMILFFFRTYHHAAGINPGDNLTIGPSKHHAVGTNPGITSSNVL